MHPLSSGHLIRWQPARLSAFTPYYSLIACVVAFLATAGLALLGGAK